MRLAAFSLQNYRSITKAEKLNLGDLTILIGPNNEGKSNILLGLVTAIQALAALNVPSAPRSRSANSVASMERIVRSRIFGAGPRGLYDWERDFPISLQKSKPLGATVFDFDFELTPDEVSEFHNEVKSELNGILPIQLSISADNYTFKVTKRGRGGPALSKKEQSIARFVAKRLNIRSIATVRTAHSTMKLVDEMVAQELELIQHTPGFQAAIDQINALQEPILVEISNNIQTMLKTFLPEIKNVEIRTKDIYSALRSNTEIFVDDGSRTDLRMKGDGVQSLAAIALTHHVSQEAAGGRTLVLALEEPEAHLHPRAIHQVRGVIKDISNRQQVIVTTHSPLLIRPGDLSNVVIVDKHRARKARSLQDVREVLGIRLSDNLSSASLVILVEGESDVRILDAVLKRTDGLSSSMNDGQIAIEPLHGVGNLAARMSQHREQMCSVHALIDNDKAAKEAFDRAKLYGALPVDVTFAACVGRRESEMEDLVELGLYAPIIKSRYGVDLAARKFNGKKGKWSERMKEVFEASGKTWDDETQREAKRVIAEVASQNPETCFTVATREPINAFLDQIKDKLVSGI
jgi:putative ATP-dependent endonuclease of OLD family